MRWTLMGAVAVASVIASEDVPAIAKEKPAAPRADAAAPDLVKLVECRATVAEYSSLASALMSDDGFPTRMKWTEVKQPNSFLKEYKLPRPIRAFGHEASHIAFASAGILVVLDDVVPKALAANLGLKPAFPDLKKIMFAKTIHADDDATMSTRIVLNVSTVDSHPGKTLAGCEYRVEVK